MPFNQAALEEAVTLLNQEKRREGATAAVSVTVQLVLHVAGKSSVEQHRNAVKAAQAACAHLEQSKRIEDYAVDVKSAQVEATWRKRK